MAAALLSAGQAEVDQGECKKIWNMQTKS